MIERVLTLVDVLTSGWILGLLCESFSGVGVSFQREDKMEALSGGSVSSNVRTLSDPYQVYCDEGKVTEVRSRVRKSRCSLS